MKLRTRLVAVLAAVVAVLLGATPAWAAADQRIVEVSSTGGTLRVVVTPTGLAPGQSPDLSSFRLALDGTIVESKAEPLAASAAVRNTSVLVIDVSGSMAGPGMAAAKQAAAQFVNAVPANVDVGLVTFSDSVRLVVPPTKDKRRLRAAVAGLQPLGATALYDGMALGLRTAGATGARSILVLSDGEDTASSTRLEQVLAQTRRSRVVVNAVAFRTSAQQNQVLDGLTRAGGGRLVTAGRASDTAKAFTDAARDTGNQILVTARIPLQFADKSATVAVVSDAGGQELTDSVFATLGAASAEELEALGKPQPVQVAQGPLGSSVALMAGLVAVFGALAVLLAFLLTSINSDRSESRFRSRLSIYTLRGRAMKPSAQPTALGNSNVARSAVEFAGRVVKERDLEGLLAGRLEAAGIPLKAPEWLIIHLGLALLLPLALLLLSGGGLAPAILGLVLGVGGPFAYLSVKRSGRRKAFTNRLPDTLQLMAGSLSAGYSLPQSVDAVVRENMQPVSAEFNRAMVETRLGVSVEDALEGVGERMQSKDFGWVVMAVRIQREVGGNLAQVLDTVAHTLRERQRLRRHVKALAAEGLLSAYVIGGLPPLFAIYLFFVNRDYIMPLLTDPLGWAMLMVAGMTMAAGSFWMSKVVKVDV